MDFLDNIIQSITLQKNYLRRIIYKKKNKTKDDLEFQKTGLGCLTKNIKFDFHDAITKLQTPTKL
jgi:hypothetical protein